MPHAALAGAPCAPYKIASSRDSTGRRRRSSPDTLARPAQARTAARAVSASKATVRSLIGEKIGSATSCGRSVISALHPGINAAAQTSAVVMVLWSLSATIRIGRHPVCGITRSATNLARSLAATRCSASAPCGVRYPGSTDHSGQAYAAAVRSTSRFAGFLEVDLCAPAYAHVVALAFDQLGLGADIAALRCIGKVGGAGEKRQFGRYLIARIDVELAVAIGILIERRVAPGVSRYAERQE